ncbi:MULTISPECIES: hypothetical protein [unclassified Granulicatella]|uniref:hypothetical protein n=1 Tax=unclassified Granulicatella TaxID=2630493 RepID=UPI0025555DAA|nr:MULTISPECIES: hypothetical protein [unclassified Granulicatella]MDK8381251.1 hypothetical protein [Granulicatella sp. UMB5615B]MDK8523406.1 hypothetical protein [Granulicatella sp. UMB5615A]
MKDLEQLKQLILADLEKESKQRIEVATKEQEERINQMNAQYSQQEMAKKTALKQEAKSQYEKEQQTILNASKKEVLRVKRELLESVFEDVLQVMSTWSGETLRLFIESAIRNLPKQQTTLAFGEETVSRLSDEEKHALTSQFAFVHIDEATLPKKAGFVLKQEGIEYNYLFESLIEDLKEEYSPILARKAFIG